jgi:hypothetical protein
VRSVEAHAAGDCYARHDYGKICGLSFGWGKEKEAPPLDWWSLNNGTERFFEARSNF